MEVKGIGSLHFDTCILKNVMYVPDLSTNLLSVNAITDKGGEVLFTKTGVEVKQQGKVVIRGNKSKSGLYKITLETKKEEMAYSIPKENMSTEWHKRLGHLSTTNMKKLTGMSTGIKLQNEMLKNLENCEICCKAKQTRLPFKTVRSKAKRLLQLIHTDLCGPIDPVAWNEKKIYTHIHK
ncbi:copia protein [Lasius niger]|uniref:Copia protein n=1 Tax=Lasius niger TaxID=67767 RepID=A0A0J7JU82_LASNI|nr:copia protein [Lasius niger]